RGGAERLGLDVGRRAAGRGAAETRLDLSAERILVVPHDAAIGGDLEKAALRAGADERVAVRQALAAREEVGEEVRGVRRGVAPARFRRAERGIAGAREAARRGERRNGRDERAG